MGEKIYSLVIKGQRVEFTQSDLDNIKKGNVESEKSKQIVCLFTKSGRLDVTKEEFDSIITKNAEEQKPEETK